MKRYDEDDEVEGEIVEKWSVKRILIGGTLFLILFSVGGIYVWENHVQPTVQKMQNVLGVSSDPPPPVVLPSRSDAEKILKNAQKELLQIAPENLVSSSAAITKIINDLESLRSGSSKPSDLLCRVVCK